MKVATLEGLNATEVRAGVSRSVFSGDGATLAFTTLEPGHTARPHSHPHEQIVYVLEGELLFVVGDEEAVLAAGDMVVVPPGVEHWAQTLGEGPAVDLSVFTPHRAEYAAEEIPGTPAPEVRSRA
jgi:quercetin dioxygenase-like cupin family protein